MDSKYAPLLRALTPNRRLDHWVLGPSYTPGAFNSHGVDCPFPFRHEGRFHMTFVGFDGVGYQTGMASSEDLLHWEDIRFIARREGTGTRAVSVAITSILRDNDLFGSGEVKRVDGRYVGTYHSYPEQGYEQGPAAIGICYSRNLLSWEFDPPCLRHDEGGAWERGGLYKSFLLEHEGTYYLFYNAKTEGEPWVEQTGMATSKDLVRWERHSASPVLRLGPSGAFDDTFASDPVVLRAGSCWVLFYFGNCSDGHARDGVAFSEDLVTWDKAPGPILDVGSEGRFDSRHAHKPGIIYHDGRLYHFYCAVAPEPSGRVGEIATGERRGIGLAVSDKGDSVFTG